MMHFRELNVQDSKLSVSGSVKFDIQIPRDVYKQGDDLRNALGKNRPVWIAASTHEGEDEIILAAYKNIKKKIPDCILILVPRHPERFDEVYKLCINDSFKTVRRSTSSSPFPPDTDVFLGDTLGEMLLFLIASDVCFMGGSLLGKKVGGHNVLEPAALGVPTITGESYYNFLEICTALLDKRLLSIANSSEQIANNVVELLNNPKEIENISNELKHFVHQNRGAIDTSITTILKAIHE
jgi:3-deoxy-D-manno-octulosonic-acid transferase